MSLFILGIDAGGTKTQGLLKCLKSSKSWTSTVGPGSLTNDISGACNNITDVAESLLSQVNCTAAETILICGAAGANNDAAKSRLEKTLEAMCFQQIVVTTDAKIALYGAGKGEPAIVIVLGTGSVAMRLDSSGCEKQFGGWGFSVGDQGSGGSIGKQLVKSILHDFDRDDFEADKLTTEILKVIGNDRQEILIWLNEVTPTKYAAFSPLVSKSAADNRLAKKILQGAAGEVESLINVCQTNPKLPVCLLGGLSKTIFPMLSKQTQAQIIPAKGTAIDGAIYLGEQLINRMHLTNDDIL